MSLPTEDEVLAMFEAVKNWGRWGEDDQRGTLNLITEEHRVRAARLVQDGTVVGCGLPLDTKPSLRNREPVQHHTLIAGDVAPDEGYALTSDFFSIASHGPANTHLDALCHVIFDGKMYNGYPASSVTSQGARKNDITVAAPAITSRGLLLDMPLLFDTDYIRSGHHIRRADLEAAEERAGVRVEAGDVVLVRLGRHTRYQIEGPACERLDGKTHMAGLHPDCLGWLHERGVALLGSDAAHDILPTPWSKARVPIHVGTLVYMGLHLLDGADLDAVADACSARSRWEFMFVLAPLLLHGGTASPVNPVAIF